MAHSGLPLKGYLELIHYQPNDSNNMKDIVTNQGYSIKVGDIVRITAQDIFAKLTVKHTQNVRTERATCRVTTSSVPKRIRQEPYSESAVWVMLYIS